MLACGIRRGGTWAEYALIGDSGLLLAMIRGRVSAEDGEKGVCVNLFRQAWKRSLHSTWNTC